MNDLDLAREVCRRMGELYPGVKSALTFTNPFELVICVLLSAQKQMSRQGSMKLTNVGESILEIFEVTGFSEILTIE